MRTKKETDPKKKKRTIMKLTSLVSKLFTAGKTLTQPQGDKDKNHLTGPCGEHAEWAFSPGDGRLRIFGTGATHDFFGARKLPWKPFLPSIRIICVEEGITYVGFQAFCYANHVEEVRLPLSLLHIGQHCFSYCTDLSAIQLPEKLQAIGDYAFAHCTSLREIVLPASLVRVGKSAFARCSRLASATFLSAGSTDIGSSCFTECTSLAHVRLPDRLDRVNASLFHRCMSLVAISLPPTVSVVDDAAFESCCRLETADFPSSVHHIGKRVFAGCYRLARLSLPFPGSGTPASFRNFGELFGTLPDKEMRMITQELDETSTQIYYMPMNLSVLQIKEGCEILPHTPFSAATC